MIETIGQLRVLGLYSPRSGRVSGDRHNQREMFAPVCPPCAAFDREVSGFLLQVDW